MNIYIFENVDHLTENDHKSGGLVIVATSKDSAQQQFDEYAKAIATRYEEDCELTEEDWQNANIYHLDDSHVVGERMFVFPNAGCC